MTESERERVAPPEIATHLRWAAKSFPVSQYPAYVGLLVTAANEIDRLRALLSDPAYARAGEMREALREIERIYYTEGKDATWRAAHMRDVATRALLDGER